MSEQQSVQVEDQAGIQRAPVLQEQVVLGVAVACQLLFAPAAPRRCTPADDPLCAVGGRDDDASDRGGRVDAMEASAIGESGEQARHLVAVERLRATAEVDRAEPGDDMCWHPSDKRIEIGEAAQETSQATY